MTRIKRAIPLWMACLLLAPVAAATWSWNGGAEPSTPYDVPTLMWPDVPGDRTGRVYFNVVSTFGATATGGLANPNVGAIKSQNEAFGLVLHEAMLGVWVDCNGDGYIGHLESGLREYPARLLDENPHCPEASPHGRHAWIVELIPIGRGIDPTTDNRVIVDEAARVWGDRGRPHDPYTPGPSGEQKRSADWNFVFEPSRRGGLAGFFWNTGPGGPDAFLGVGNRGSRWVADDMEVRPLPRTVQRNTSFEEPVWYTFYAWVSEEHVLPGSKYTPPQYGRAQCPVWGGVGRGNWNCNPDDWNPDATPGAVAVFYPYRLRDVDCLSGENAHGVATGLPAYGWRCADG